MTEQFFGHGRLSYVQIPAADVQASAAFYAGVFGWQVRGGSADHLSFSDATGDIIGAWVMGLAPSREPGVLPYIYVHGIDASVHNDDDARIERQWCEMDLETASAIESLRKDLDRTRTDLGDRIAGVETSLGRQLATVENTLRAEMRQMRDGLTRHTAVLTESVRDDVRIVADGLAAVTAELVAVSAKIDALKR
jgi:hypothetical protein